MSSFRNGESRVFGLNDSGIWQYRSRLKEAFGEGSFDSLRPFWGPIQRLSPDTRETVPPIQQPTQTSVKDVREATKRSEAARGLRTSFFNNKKALEIIVRNVYDLTDDQRFFQNIAHKLQHSVSALEGLKSAESTTNLLSFNFMPMNTRTTYTAKDLKDYFTLKDLLFPEQLKKPIESYEILQDIVKNFRTMMMDLMTEPLDSQRWNNILSPMYDSFDTGNSTQSIKIALPEDMYSYLNETFRNMVRFLTNEETESLSADEIEAKLTEIWKIDTNKLLIGSTQARNLRDARKRELEESEPSSASSNPGAGGRAGLKRTAKGAKSGAASNAGANKPGTDLLCLSDCALVIRDGKNAAECSFGTKCRYKHAKLPYLKKRKDEVLKMFEAARDSKFNTESIAIVKAWP